MINRREFLKGAALAGTAAMFGTKVFASGKKARIGVLAPSHCALPIAYAQSQGLFRKSGVEAGIVYLSDSLEIIKGVQRGELEFGQVVGPLAIAMSAGTPQLRRTPLVAMQVLGTNGGVLAVSAGKALQRITDLKGKTLGVHSPLMVHALILNHIFEKSGITAGKDVSVKVVPMGEIGKALQEGVIDGFINPEPLSTALEKKGVARTLLATQMFWSDHPCCLLVAKRSLMEKERSLVEDVTRSTMIAGLILDNSATRGKAIADVHAASSPYGTMPLPVLLQAFSPGRSDFSPFPYLSAGQVIVDRMKKDGLLPASTDTNALAAEVFQADMAMEIMRDAAREVPGSRLPGGPSREEKIRLA